MTSSEKASSYGKRTLFRSFLFLLPYFVFLLAGSIPVKKAVADEMLFVSPTRITLDRKQRVETIRLHNKANSRRVYDIIASDIVMTEEGHTTETESFDYSAKRMIRFVPRRVDMQPDERMVVRIMFRPDASVSGGDFHSHLFFKDITSEVLQAEAQNRTEEEKRDDAKEKEIAKETGEVRIAAALAFSIGIPVVVSYGNSTTDIAFEKADLTVQSERPVVTLSLKRNGNGQGLAYMDTYHIKPDGSKERVKPPVKIRIYREIDRLKKAIQLPKSLLGQEGKLEIIAYDKAGDPVGKDSFLGSAIFPLP